MKVLYMFVLKRNEVLKYCHKSTVKITTFYIGITHLLFLLFCK